MNRTIWVGEIKKDSSYIADANLCVIGYDKGKNEYKNPKKRVYDIAKELSRYTIPEADETRILFSGDSYLLEGPDVRGIIALAKVGFYSDDNFDGFTGVFTGIEPSGLNLLQGRREPLFVMKQYPWHDVALPKGAKEMLNLATKFKIYFEGTGSDETGVRDLIFSRLDTSADKIAKDDFWKKVDGLCLPKSSVVVCETELDFGNKGKDVVIRGESELEIWLPKRNTIVSRVFPDGHDLSVERKLIPYVKYPGHLSAGDKYWGGGTTHPEKVWGL